MIYNDYIQSYYLNTHQLRIAVYHSYRFALNEVFPRPWIEWMFPEPLVCVSTFLVEHDHSKFFG